MIEQEKIDTIKATVDMIALVEARGIRLHKNGQSHFGLCPFHNDKHPSFSITPKTNLWHCFGCGKGGDVIRFVELFDQVDFKEAVKRLSDNGFKSSKTSAQIKQPHKDGKTSARLLKLLNRVIEFYHTAFCEDARAKEYLNKQGIVDNAIFTDFKIGFASGTLLNVLPSEGDTYEQLKQIGILTVKGQEHFYGYVTIPLYDPDGNPCGIYGRRLDDLSACLPERGRSQSGSAQAEMVSGPDHLYLPGPRHGLFNRQAAKSHKDIILTESIIDALTLINTGIKNTIPCYGTNGFLPEHLTLLTQYEVRTVYICFDADESGRQATESVFEKLQAQNIKAHVINLPDGQDINDFFLLAANPADKFKELLSQADPGLCPADKEKEEKVVKTEYGFIMATGERMYEVRGLARGDNKLKATVKGIKGEGSRKRMHVDTVDFYSARSRAYLVKGLCDLFSMEEPIIRVHPQFIDVNHLGEELA